MCLKYLLKNRKAHDKKFRIEIKFDSNSLI